VDPASSTHQVERGTANLVSPMRCSRFAFHKTIQFVSYCRPEQRMVLLPNISVFFAHSVRRSPVVTCMEAVKCNRHNDQTTVYNSRVQNIFTSIYVDLQKFELYASTIKEIRSCPKSLPIHPLTCIMYVAYSFGLSDETDILDVAAVSEGGS
jgi:hypothetical protein